MRKRDYFYKTLHSKKRIFEMLRAGILMPRSTLYPSLGLDLLNGLKQSLKQQNIFDEIKLLIDNIGFGTDEPEIYSKAEKMLLQEDADIVVVCADSRIAEMLQPLFTASNKILFVVNFGASFPDTWQPALTTITHTLNFAFHSMLTGKLAAAETNKQAVNVISYYDGGYRQCYTMLSSHQENGGVARFNHITHLKISEFTLQPMAGYLEQNTDVQTLLCLFSGEQAVRFYQEVIPLQEKFNLQLYVSPMMLDDSLKPLLGNDVTLNNVKGFVPWHASLENEHNQQFIKFYSQSTNQPVNYFSLLGWDAGLIMKEILVQQQAGEANAAAIVKSITGKHINSPRGWLKIDAATHQSYGPAYLATSKGDFEIDVKEWLVKTPTTEVMTTELNTPITEPGSVDDEWANYTKITLPPGESSSWRNTYLCI
jgi:branched-chain amino acid transport system substrate-binding protein